MYYLVTNLSQVSVYLYIFLCDVFLELSDFELNTGNIQILKISLEFSMGFHSKHPAGPSGAEGCMYFRHNYG